MPDSQKAYTHSRLHTPPSGCKVTNYFSFQRHKNEKITSSETKVNRKGLSENRKTTYNSTKRHPYQALHYYIQPMI